MANLNIDDAYFRLSAIHEFHVDLDTRELYLTGESEVGEEEILDEPGVEHVMATRLIKNLRLLQSDSDSNVLIHMKTCGGFETEGFAIYDAIRFCPCHITILCYTHARSMSSIILQAADHRVMMPNSYFMIHWGEEEISGEQQKVLSWAEWTRKMEPRFIGVYLDQMEDSKKFGGWKRRDIERMLREKIGGKTDVILTPEETIDWGLADEVFSGNWKALK